MVYGLVTKFHCGLHTNLILTKAVASISEVEEALQQLNKMVPKIQRDHNNCLLTGERFDDIMGARGWWAWMGTAPLCHGQPMDLCPSSAFKILKVSLVILVHKDVIHSVTLKKSWNFEISAEHLFIVCEIRGKKTHVCTPPPPQKKGLFQEICNDCVVCIYIYIFDIYLSSLLIFTILLFLHFSSKFYFHC